MDKFLHICEVCGKEELLTSEEAFNEGWDYPPNIGSFGIIGPRTCPNCRLDDTLWFELTMKRTPVEELSERHKKTLSRIVREYKIYQHIVKKLDDAPKFLN